jgi:hypothetical protein
MLQELTSASFEAHVGTVFRVLPLAGDPLELTLDAVRLLEPHPGPRAQPFSAYFRGPRNPVLPQQIYRLEHAAMGDLELFLVPIGPDPTRGGMNYEAVFN